MFAILGSPVQTFIDAVKAALEADAELMALIEGVFGHVSEAARVDYPYLVLGHRHLDDGRARSMGVDGGQVSLMLDGWSDHKGASQMQAICSRVRQVLERTPLRVAPFTLMAGSLHCEFEDVFDEPDEDAPTKKLYHGVQRWVAELDGAS